MKISKHGEKELHIYIYIYIYEETNKMLHLEQRFVWQMESSENRSEVP